MTVMLQLTDIPPATAILAGAALLPFVTGRARWAVALALPVFALVHAWLVISAGAGGGGGQIEFLGMALTPVAMHGPTAVFATIFCLMLLGGAVFALGQRESRVDLPAAFLYAGGALGVVFAGDLLTMFIFWEIMLLGSVVVIWQGRQPGSPGAGMRYFALHAVGGALLLAGIALVASQRAAVGDADPLAFSHLAAMVQGWRVLSFETAGMWLMLAGMLVNAGAPPFSPWIADAYPEGSASGTVFLSAFTTKTAVFTLMIAFAGVEPLVWLGLFMCAYGVIYAALENDPRRMLAYAIVTQVGVMLIGIGVGGALAADGASAHAFSHIAYKGLLMMCAGGVLYVTGKRRMTEMGGLRRAMPVTLVCAAVGVLAMSGLPFTASYGGKSMISQAVNERAAELAAAGLPHAHLTAAGWALVIVGPAVLVLVGASLLWFVFLRRDGAEAAETAEPPLPMRGAMIGVAAFCLLLGVAPGALNAILPGGAEGASVAYGFGAVAKLAGLLLGSGLAFLLLLPVLRWRPGIRLDFDWFWRRLAPFVWKRLMLPLLRLASRGERAAVDALPAHALKKGALPYKVRARLGTSWAVSVPVSMVTLMLLVFLVLYLAT